MLRLMLWLALRNDAYNNSQMCIVVGSNIDLAKKLIKRMKGVFDKFPGIFETDTDTVLEINKAWIQAFPSNHLDAYRALANPKFILIDEADFFRKGEQEDVRHVSERYIGKSDPYIVMVSTPDAPDGLFEKIEKEPEESCLYKRLFMDYTYGLDRIYTGEEIEKAKVSPSFEREYNLKYLGKIGNVFHTKDIDNAMDVQYNPDIVNKMAAISMGVDPGFGSSPFGIVVTQLSDNKIQVLFADEFERPSHEDMLSKVLQFNTKYKPTRIYVDGANPAFIKSLKLNIGERADYDRVIEQANHDKIDFEYLMKVIPVPFNQEHKGMLGHTKLLLEEGYAAIDGKRFDKLVTSLRTAVEKGDGVLDKEATSYDDIFDAFRLSLRLYQYNWKRKK